MCDKNTRSVCAIGIYLNEAIVCVHDREGVSQEGNKILHRYKERERHVCDGGSTSVRVYKPI